jgi:hypothetical protein
VSCSGGSDQGEVLAQFPLFPVHEFLAVLWQSGYDNFAKSCFATEGLESIGAFWSHVRNLDWCKSHPAVEDHARLPWTIPAAMFGDDARIYKEEKMTVYEFAFVLSAATTLQSKFIVAILPNWIIIPGKTCADVERAITWSWRCAFEGLWPTHDHLGREIAEEHGSHRFRKWQLCITTRFPAGWCILFPCKLFTNPSIYTTAGPSARRWCIWQDS